MAKMTGLSVILIILIAVSGLCGDDFHYYFAGFYTSDNSADYFSQCGYVTFDKTINNFNAQLQISFKQNFSMYDTVNFELRQGSISYVNDWLRVSIGRLSLYNYLTPCRYFGSYNTMGLRRLQGFLVTTNFLLKTGVSDNYLVSIPPTALTAGYFPNFFSHTTYIDGVNNGLFVSQFRTKIGLFDFLSSSFAVNFSMYKNISFLYSVISGDPAVSLTYSFNVFKDYYLYGELAYQNVYEPCTSVFTAGTSIKLSDLVFGIFDNLVVESQLPVNPSKDNIFTGGNTFITTFAELPQPTYYARLSKSFDKLEISLSMTNNVGDYTFARPSPSSLKYAVLSKIYTGNEDDTSLSEFLSGSYFNIAYRLAVSYQF